MLVAVLFILVSCSQKKNNETEINNDGVETTVVDEVTDEKDVEIEEDESLDAVGNQIRTFLASKSNDYRFEFLSFWRFIEPYCYGVEYDLAEFKNTGSYEFDPSDSSQIPEELKEASDFERISSYNRKGLFEDFNMTVDGRNVTFSFEGIEAYPSDYDYDDIAAIISSLE